MALAHHRPKARVVAVDDSAEALSYARRNGGGVELRQADVTAAGLFSDLDGQVDLVVANPPYVPEGSVVEREVAEHDPVHAVFGGPDGMAVIGPIVELASRLLRSGGLLAVEHDDTTAARTMAVFEATAAFDAVTSRRDLVGRPRFVTGTRRERS